MSHRCHPKHVDGRPVRFMGGPLTNTDRHHLAEIVRAVQTRFTKEKTVRRYRKKSVEIEAVQWTGDVNPVRVLAGGLFHPLCIPRGDITAEVKDVLHNTWLGVKDGEWIIKGVKGELYPCDDEVFAATYDPVEEQADG